MKATVYFTKYYSYDVDLPNDEMDEDEAISATYDFFRRDCCRPVVDASYDEVEVQFWDED